MISEPVVIQTAASYGPAGGYPVIPAGEKEDVFFERLKL